MTTQVETRLAEQLRERDLPAPDVCRALRMAAGLSQREFAKTVGVTHAAVGYWETGRRTPRGARRVAYAAAMRLLAARGVA